MKIYQSLLLIIISAFLIAGCSKKEDKPLTEKKQETTEQLNNNGEIENPQDTVLSPEEQFSTAIMSDFLENSEDEDLQDYLETEIYKYGETYNGVSVIAISPSTWFVSFEKDNNNKNFILQKYLDFKSGDPYFRMKETNLTVNDIAKK